MCSHVFVHYLPNISICLGLKWFLYLGILHQEFIDVGTGVLVELGVAGDHHNGDLCVAQYAELVRLLQQAIFTLAKCYLHTCISLLYHDMTSTDLSVPFITNAGNRDFLSPHIKVNYIMELYFVVLCLT